MWKLSLLTVNPGEERWALKRLVKSEDLKLEKGPTDKAKEPDPGGSDQQNLGFKKLKTEKLTVRLAD